MKKVHGIGVICVMVWGSGATWAQSTLPDPTAPLQAKAGEKDFNFEAEVARFIDGLDKLDFDTHDTQEENDKAVAASPNDPKVYNKRGHFYFDKKNYDKARADYEKAAQLDPKWAEPHGALALLYRAQKDTKNALAEYGKAIALEAPTTEMLRNRGDYFAELGLSDKALADYNQAITQQPEEFRNYLWRALFYKGQKQLDKALLDYNKIVELRPTDDDYIFEQAETLRELKRYGEAIAGYQKALDLNPKRVFLLNEIANTYWEAGVPEKTLEFFNKGIATNDEKTQRYGYFNRGLVFYAQGKGKESVSDLSKAIEMETALRAAKGKEPMKDTAFAQAYFYRGIINGHKLSLLSKEADFAPVSDDATRAVQLDPTLIDQYKGVTATPGDENAKYSIAAMLAGASTAKPNDLELLLKLAAAQRNVNKPESAAQTYTKALALDPKSLPALSGRAEAYSHFARPYNVAGWTPAVADWKSYLALKPDDNKARQQLGIAQYNVGQTADGIASFQQVLATEKENAYAHVMLGLGKAISGDKDGATIEAQNYIKKLNPAETTQAKSNAGNATAHYPQNAAVKALFDLIPGGDDDADDDNAPLFFV